MSPPTARPSPLAPLIDAATAALEAQVVWNHEEVGVMHACGHDAHTAILMGGARVLAGKRAQRQGSVKFIVQPAEAMPPEGEEGGAAPVDGAQRRLAGAGLGSGSPRSGFHAGAGPPGSGATRLPLIGAAMSPLSACSGLRSATAVAMAALLLTGTCWAGLYPLPPAFVGSIELAPGHFIQRLVDVSPGLESGQLDVLGPKLDRHPGAVLDRFGVMGAFVGVFDYTLDRHHFGADAGVMLWETSGVDLGGMAGPAVQLGYWDGTLFTPVGHEVVASYQLAGYSEAIHYLINASVIPFYSFGVVDESPLNAIRLTAQPWAHNMVSAVAANFTVSEPSSLLLAALAAAAWWSAGQGRSGHGRAQAGQGMAGQHGRPAGRSQPR